MPARPRLIADIPALVVAPPHATGPLPLVVWYHGFNAAKESHATELERVAALGMLAVGVDAVGHGARRLVDFDDRKRGEIEHVRGFMLSLAAATAAELPTLVDVLAAEGLADPSRVSIVGISMGGYLVYRAVADHPFVRTAVALLGSPVWPHDPASPHLRPDAFAHVALCSITAERDESVPAAEARAFHEQLTARASDPSRLDYLELRDAPHLMNGAQWATAMDATFQWLARFSGPGVVRPLKTLDRTRPRS